MIDQEFNYLYRGLAERKKAPRRQTILDRIDHLINTMHRLGGQFAEQRVKPAYSQQAMEYAYKAEALIDLLEIHDCDFTGGWDGGEKGLYSLEERFDLLKRKY